MQSSHFLKLRDWASDDRPCEKWAFFTQWEANQVLSILTNSVGVV